MGLNPEERPCKQQLIVTTVAIKSNSSHRFIPGGPDQGNKIIPARPG